jgi:hypothetical protein
MFRTFLPALLFDEDMADDDPRLKLACLPVKHAGLALPDPTRSAQSNHVASILMCSHLLAAFRDQDPFRTTDHLAVIHAVKDELKSRHQENYKTELNSIVSTLSCDDSRTILASGSRQCHPPSTAQSLSSKNFEAHFYSATRSHREIFNLTVMDAARSVVFDMVVSARKVAS